MEIIDARQSTKKINAETYAHRNVPQLVGSNIAKFRFIVSAAEPAKLPKSLARMTGKYHEAMYLLSAGPDVVTTIMKGIAGKYRDDPRFDNSPTYHHKVRKTSELVNLILLRRLDNTALITARALNAARRRTRPRKIKHYENIGEICVQNLKAEDLAKFHALNATLAASCKQGGSKSLLHVSERMMDERNPGAGQFALVSMYGLTPDAFSPILPILNSSGLDGYITVQGARKRIVIDEIFGRGVHWAQWTSSQKAADARDAGDRVGMLFWDLVSTLKSNDAIDRFMAGRTLTPDALSSLVTLAKDSGINTNITTRILDIDYAERVTIMALGTWLYYQARGEVDPISAPVSAPAPPSDLPVFTSVNKSIGDIQSAVDQTIYPIIITAPNQESAAIDEAPQDETNQQTKACTPGSDADAETSDSTSEHTGGDRSSDIDGDHAAQP